MKFCMSSSSETTEFLFMRMACLVWPSPNISELIHESSSVSICQVLSPSASRMALVMYSMPATVCFLMLIASIGGMILG